MCARGVIGFLICALVQTVVTAHAQGWMNDEPRNSRAQVSDSTLGLATRLASIPPHFEHASGRAVELTMAFPGPAATRPTRALLDMIASWLRANFDLPAQGEPPHIELVPSAKLFALRYSGFTAWGEVHLDSARQNGSSSDTPEIEALYDDKRRTIYLRDDWQGGTFTEISILVHEMVHHLQNLAGMKYECLNQRERLAYEAQGKWLAIFGKDIGEEFGIDPITMIAKGLCWH